MPLYQIHKENLKLVRSTPFTSERELQVLVEQNLSEIFACRFIASEFSTGEVHGGRIDTLALSEENHPVIIEYKKVESSQLVNQSLYYLSWLEDHKGDFELAVMKSLDQKVEIDWSNIRVICIAPGYKKYDLHAVRMMGANIELYEYKLFDNQTLMLEEVFMKSSSIMELGKVTSSGSKSKGKSSKLSPTPSPVYQLEDHLSNKSPEIVHLVQSIREFILDLDESIQEVPKKLYIAYKVNKNFVCIEVQKRKIYLYLKLDPKSFKPLPPHTRDVSQIGHFGTGDLEFTLASEEVLGEAKALIREAFEGIGG